MKTEKRGGSAALIWRFLKGCRIMFLISMICAAVSALTDMIIPQIIRAAIDNAIGGQPANFSRPVMELVDRIGGFSYLGKHLWIMAAAVIAVALVRVAAQYIFRVSNTRGTERLAQNTRNSLYSHIARLPFSWHLKNHTGDIIQRCTSDIDVMKNFVSEQLTSIFRIVLLLVLSITFMLTMNPRLTLIAAVPMPVIVFYSFYFHSKIGKSFRSCDEAEGKLSAMVQENLTGVRVVRAFGKERYEKDRFHDFNEHYTGLWVRLSGIMSRFWSVGDVLSGLQALLVIVFGAVFCVKDSMTAGEYVAFISYNSLLMWPIRRLGRMISELSKAGVSVERIKYVMDAEEEKDPEGLLTPDMSGDIVFDGVSFSYDGGQDVLDNVSFTVKGGTTLGILGGTGSGKSTVVQLLDKLYPSCDVRGKITVGGVDIADISTPYLRKNIGIVLQEPYLFSRTIKENISLMTPDASDEEIDSAVEDACLQETLQSFTKGYDTFVGERGVTLSGGQKQRTAIARTLIRSTPIMIFDDSLSAVDTETDVKIRKAIEQRFGSATVILISHRITTLSKADKVVVLDKGRVAEQGTPDELKCAGGIYEQIYKIQSAAEED